MFYYLPIYCHEHAQVAEIVDNRGSVRYISCRGQVFMKVPSAMPRKTAYFVPKLKVYGSLTDLTAAQGAGPMTDVSMGHGNKTT